MKFLVVLLIAIAMANIVVAQNVPKASAGPEMPAPPHDMPERFMGVTAENGQEWIDQCEWPVHKSDSTVRIGACISFLQGARLVASKSNARELCADDIANQTRGAMLTTTYQVARRYPHLPLKTIFKIAFDSVEPAPCGQRP
ncbi:MAG TPA: hypothetical protein VGO51_01530 [Burkholderiaceae bacterium]|jgi:hypothetical protein|nr:hypothetical protein [Burkholderiaceae bacterium]